MGLRARKEEASLQREPEYGEQKGQPLRNPYPGKV